MRVTVITPSRVDNFTITGTSFTRSMTLEDNAPTVFYAVAYDDVGNSAESEKITVLHDSRPPMIEAVSPLQGSTINNDKPTISAFALETGSGLSLGSEQILVNSVIYGASDGVDYLGDSGAGKISYYYDAGLAKSADGKGKVYEITARMMDNAGLTGSRTWQFYYDPDAPVLMQIIPSTNSMITNAKPEIITSFSEQVKTIEITLENNGNSYSYRLIENVNGANQTFVFRNDTVSLSGRVDVGINIVDFVGNAAHYTSVFTVDAELPKITDLLSLSHNAGQMTTNSQLEMSWSGEDIISGIEKYEYDPKKHAFIEK